MSNEGYLLLFSFLYKPFFYTIPLKRHESGVIFF